MKKFSIIAIIILFAISAHAQTGMPRELTCTEEAFNFNISFGTKWKLSPLQMGPAEILRTKPDDTPAWSFGESRAEKPLPLFDDAFSGGILIYQANQQTRIPASYANAFKIAVAPVYLPGINYSPPINYKLSKPALLVNSN